MVQINLPAYNPAISDIVRVYLLFCKDGCGTRIIRYFVIKCFRDGSYYILFVSLLMGVINFCPMTVTERGNYTVYDQILNMK